MRFLLFPAAVLLVVPAGCASSGPAATTSLELRKVVTTRAGGAGNGTPLSQADRQSRDPARQNSALRAIECPPGRPDPLAGHDDRALPLVTCAQSGGTAYVLEPGFPLGSDVSDATSAYNPQSGQWVVNLTFTAEGTKVWGDFTSKNVDHGAAFVLDGQVISVEEVRTTILDGQAQLAGRFTEQRALELARQLGG